MPAPARPRLQPGRVYSTAELSAWGKNPSRLARRLLREGRLQRVGPGLFVLPRAGRFGPVPPGDDELLRAFLKDSPYLITGPERWNALGLGATALFAVSLVYNTKRSGELRLGGRRFLFRRLKFPLKPTAEWFAVDLIEHHAMAGASLEELERGLAEAVAVGRLNARRLERTAGEYASRRTVALVERALRASAVGA